MHVSRFELSTVLIIKFSLFENYFYIVGEMDNKIDTDFLNFSFLKKVQHSFFLRKTGLHFIDSYKVLHIHPCKDIPK